MDPPQLRFAHAVRGLGVAANDLGKAVGSPFRAGASGWHGTVTRVWPFGQHEGQRTTTARLSANGGGGHQLCIVAAHGSGVSGVEVMVGFNLHSPALDADSVTDLSSHLEGRLLVPETAPATRGTVQLSLATVGTDGSVSEGALGLTRLRARTAWRADGRHVLQCHREMPEGWPESPHEERDEQTITAGTGTFGAGETLLVGLPWLVQGHQHIVEFRPYRLRDVVDYVKLAVQSPG